MSRTAAYRSRSSGSIAAALQRAASRLNGAGIERSRAEARLLLEAATGLSRAAIIGFPERELDPAQSDVLDRLLARRCAREPMSRILGRREFWSLTFRVTEATLDPRPDSETLVAAVLDRIVDHAATLTILDLGTGTGCLLLALLSELPKARGTGVDISPEAVDVARANAIELGLSTRAEFVVGDWARDVRADFDIVISNPPYIQSEAIAGLEPEVARHEPRRALDGGFDGLDAYRALLPDVVRLLVPGGLLALEVGAGQAASVGELAVRSGFHAPRKARDLSGIERCLLFEKAA